MSNALTAAPAARGDRKLLTSGRAATLVALVAVLLAVTSAVLFVPVSPTTASAETLTSADAAAQRVQDAHAASCPGVAPSVVCTARDEDWSCSWGTFRDVRISRTPSPALSVGC